MGKTWSGNNRVPWHDYTQRQIYLITLKKDSNVTSFGCIAGDWRLPKGSYGRSYLKASPLGAIIKTCLRVISTIHPALKIYQYALMPDHLHILLSVENVIDEILGRKLAAFKVLVNKKADIERVFEKGFNDQILTASRNLNVIYEYLRENPFRLAIRYAHRDFFSRVNQMKICGRMLAAYGNFQLLSNPFKAQVVIHRADSEEIKKRNREKWLHIGLNGGVLVSPFISPAEKAIRTEAESKEIRIILITHEAFPERFKPSAREFGLCAEGRLLIISLGYPAGTSLRRSICIEMNTLAESLTSRSLDRESYGSIF